LLSKLEFKNYSQSLAKIADHIGIYKLTLSCLSLSRSSLGWTGPLTGGGGGGAGGGTASAARLRRLPPQQNTTTSMRPQCCHTSLTTDTSTL